MKKKTLAVIKRKNKTIILKKPKKIVVGIALASLIIILLLPIFLDSLLKDIKMERAKSLLVAIIYIVCAVSNLFILIRLFLEKTVLDFEQRQLRLYTPFRNTKNFSEINRVEVFYLEKTLERDPVSKVILYLNSGKKISLPVVDKLQAEELSEMLKPVVVGECEG